MLKLNKAPVVVLSVLGKCDMPIFGAACWCPGAWFVIGRYPRRAGVSKMGFRRIGTSVSAPVQRELQSVWRPLCQRPSSTERTFLRVQTPTLAILGSLRCSGTPSCQHKHYFVPQIAAVWEGVLAAVISVAHGLSPRSAWHLCVRREWSPSKHSALFFFLWAASLCLADTYSSYY